MRRALTLLCMAAAILIVPAILGTTHMPVLGALSPQVATACDYGDNNDCNPDDWCDAWSYDCEEDPDNCTDSYTDQFIGDDEGCGGPPPAPPPPPPPPSSSPPPPPPPVALHSLPAGEFDSRHGYNRAGSWRGTRAKIRVADEDLTPLDDACGLYSSVVFDEWDSRMLQVGVERCGYLAYVDQGCATDYRYIYLIIERKTAGSNEEASFVCYTHGTASDNTDYLMTVDTTDEDYPEHDIWRTYINGTDYEAQSGYHSHSYVNVSLYEWGEHTGTTSCSGWYMDGLFKDWDVWDDYPTYEWVPVEDDVAFYNHSEGCWTVEEPYLNSGHWKFRIYH